MNARQTTRPTHRDLTTEFALFPRLGTVWVRFDPDDLLAQLFLADLSANNDQLPSNARPMRESLRNAIVAYLDGSSDPFRHIMLSPASTAFSARVREAMLAIPRGSTRSYAQLAQDIGSPRAFRAIGQCCGANPIPLIVPCHRVVAAHGLGGFALGLHAKHVLLELDAISSIAS
jgi:methylated-DNA-[protein]-cysteine S-methyltransferase